MRYYWILLILLAATACTNLSTSGTAVPPTATVFQPDDGDDIPPPLPTPEETAVIPDNPATNRRVEDNNEYSFPQLLAYDAIRPVYEPRFMTAVEAPLQDDELVMGVAWGGEAKAYPVSVLRFREMVNDELNGIPTLVTW